MTDLSQLTDKQLLALTRDWQQDKTTAICQDCGREFDVPPNFAQKRARWCPDCREAHRWDSKKNPRPSFGGVQTGRMTLKRAYDGGN